MVWGPVSGKIPIRYIFFLLKHLYFVQSSALSMCWNDIYMTVFTCWKKPPDSYRFKNMLPFEKVNHGCAINCNLVNKGSATIYLLVF
jgi:hypothetical protein